MPRIPHSKPLLDRDFVPGDDGEEMTEGQDMFGCGTKYYRQGCQCVDCMDRGDYEYEQWRDRKILEEEG